MGHATRPGCDQVVFLDAVEHRWVDELGGINVFFMFDDGRMLTPPFLGPILPGIMPASIVALARARGVKVVERPYAIDQWRPDAHAGRLLEAFACGTAAVLAPISQVKSTLGDWTVGDGQGGLVTEAVRTELVDIQRGRTRSRADWVHRVTPP